MTNEEILAKVAELRELAKEAKRLREAANETRRECEEAERLAHKAWHTYEESVRAFPAAWESEVWK